jgi:hypothetical protein
MNLLEKIGFVKKITIISISTLITLTLFGLLFTSISFLTKHLFDKYNNIECNGQIYQCKNMSNWEYAGIILNLIVYSILILSVILNLGKITNRVDLIYFACISIISAIGIIGSYFTLKRTSLQCDDKYVCKDSNIKEIFMKISIIISIILISIGILGILTFGISSIFEILN